MFTQQTIEDALDRGQIEAEMNNGRWWRLRRNGATKVWKTRHWRPCRLVVRLQVPARP